MPCYDERDSPAYQIAEARKEWTHNSPVAELLCTTLKHLDPRVVAKLPMTVQSWWAAHQKRDAEKARRERKREADEQERIKQQIAVLQRKLR